MILKIAEGEEAKEETELGTENKPEADAGSSEDEDIVTAPTKPKKKNEKIQGKSQKPVVKPVSDSKKMKTSQNSGKNNKNKDKDDKSEKKKTKNKQSSMEKKSGKKQFTAGKFKKFKSNSWKSNKAGKK